MVLHLDFKTNEPAHHQAIWDLLGRHEIVADDGGARRRRAARHAVHAGSAAGASPRPARTRSTRFYTRVPVGGRLRIFGTIPPATFPAANTAEERAAAAVCRDAGGADPHRRDQLPALDQLRLGGRRARRTEQGWSVDQRRRPAAAGDRLAGARDGLVGAVLHAQRPLARPRATGWTASYNFGSLAAVRERMAAARDAGVEFIATDQYEELGAVLSQGRSAARR